MQSWCKTSYNLTVSDTNYARLMPVRRTKRHLTIREDFEFYSWRLYNCGSNVQGKRKRNSLTYFAVQCSTFNYRSVINTCFLVLKTSNFLVLYSRRTSFQVNIVRFFFFLESVLMGNYTVLRALHCTMWR